MQGDRQPDDAGHRVDAGDDAPLNRIAELAGDIRARMRELAIAPEGDAAAATPARNAAAAEAHDAAAAAQPYLRALERRAADLDQRWEDWFDAPKDLADARTLVRDTRDHLQWLPARTQALETALRERPAVSPAAAATDAALTALVAHIEAELADILAIHAGPAAAAAAETALKPQ